MTDCALVVFAKVPAAGAVKTRLVPPLTPDDAAALYAAFLADALAAFATPGAFGVEVDVRLCVAPSAVAMPAGIVPEPAPAQAGGVSVHAQRGDGLGARMQAAVADALTAGYGRVVVIGTDHPTLPLAFVGDAFVGLTEPSTVVIGPSDDGGFYLVGMNGPFPSLFEMTYSHAGVFAETLARAAEAGARTVVLPPGYDVDDGASLARLVAEWRAGVAVGRRTEAMLARLVEAGVIPGAPRPGTARLGPSAPRPGRTA